MQTTVRLSPELKLAAEAEAIRIGVSFNALMAFALERYLVQGSRRKTRVLAASKPVQVADDTSTVAVEAPVAPRQHAKARCSCGSGRKYALCHGSATERARFLPSGEAR
jgi:hypothetical protein